tara:strand:- start:2132 stop:2656 length:525 start_codon:yes stop_codon:yes gene_type:complete
MNNSDKITYRKINVNDAEKLITYFNQLVKEDKNRVERPEDAKSITLEQEIKWIKHRINKVKEQEMAVFCCEYNNTIVSVGEVEKKSRWIERHVGEIRFAFLPGYTFTAKELLKILINSAKEINLEILVYFHLSTQKKGIQLVEEFNFNHVGTINNFYKKKNKEYINREYFFKQL